MNNHIAAEEYNIKLETHGYEIGLAVLQSI